MSEPAALTPETTAKKPFKKKKRLSQERVMLFLILAFVSGILVYLVTPPDSAMRDAAVAAYVGAMMFGFIKLAA